MRALPPYRAALTIVKHYSSRPVKEAKTVISLDARADSAFGRRNHREVELDLVDATGQQQQSEEDDHLHQGGDFQSRCPGSFAVVSSGFSSFAQGEDHSMRNPGTIDPIDCCLVAGPALTPLTRCGVTDRITMAIA